MNATIAALNALRARKSKILLTIHFMTPRTYESYDLPVTDELLTA